MFILAILAMVATLVVLAYLIIYWDSTTTPRHRNNENSHQSITKTTHQRINE